MNDSTPDLPADPLPSADTVAGGPPTVPDPAPDPDPVAVPEPVPAAAVGWASDAGAASRRRQNRVAAIGAVGLVIVLAFGAGFAAGRGTAPSGGLEPVAAGSASPGASPGASTAALPSDGNRLGTADAKVVIDYWADFQCPYCSKFAREVIPQLESRIADGTVALVHRDFAFIGPESEAAAVAVRCAGREDRYWPMHDAIYAAQQGENQGGFSRERLLQIGSSVGLDTTTFTACLDDPQPLVDVLDDTAAGLRAGVKSTPTIDVNGTRFLGVPDTAKLFAAIDAAAAGASPAPLPTAAPSAEPWTGTTTDGRTAGAASAPVTVELWMDYQSADARPVVEELEQGLRTRIGQRAVRAELHDVAALGDESVAAAGFVRCVAAQDGPAWFVSDILGESAQGAGAGIFTTDNLLRLASKLGLDVKAAAACLDDAATAADVRSETTAAAADGVTAGPTIVVRKGDQELGRFTAPIDSAKILAAIDAAR